MAEKILQSGVTLITFDDEEYKVNVYSPDHMELVRLNDTKPVISIYGTNILWENLKAFSPTAPASGVKIEMPKEEKPKKEK